MPQLVEKTYKPAVAGRKKHKRPFSKAVLKRVGEGGEKNMPTLFSALYSDNIKQIKAAAGNKENSVKTRLRSWSRPRPLQPLGNSLVNKMNLILEETEFELDSSFDEIRKGPSFQPVKYEAGPRRRLCDREEKPSPLIMPHSPEISSPGEFADPLWETRMKTAKKTFSSKQRRKLIAKKKKDLPDSDEDEPLIFMTDRSKSILTRTRVRERARKARVMHKVYKDETESCQEASIDNCSKQTCASDDPFVSEEENPVFFNSSVKRTTQSPDVKVVPEPAFMQPTVSREETQAAHESRKSFEFLGIVEQTHSSAEGQESRVLRTRKLEDVQRLTQSDFGQTSSCAEDQEPGDLQKIQSEEIRRLTRSACVPACLCTEVQESNVLRTRKSEDVPRLTQSDFGQTSLHTEVQESRVLRTRKSEDVPRLTQSDFGQTSLCTEVQESRVLRTRKSEDAPRLTMMGFAQTRLSKEQQDGQESRVLRTRKSEDAPRLSVMGFAQTSLCNEQQDGQDSRVLQTRISEDVPRLPESGFLQSRLSSKVQKACSFVEDVEQGVKSEDNCDEVIVNSSGSDGDSGSLTRLSRQLKVVLTPVRFSYSSGSDDMFHSCEEGDLPVQEECNRDEKYSPGKQLGKDDDSAFGNGSNSSDFIEESPPPPPPPPLPPAPVRLWTSRTMSVRRMFHKSVDSALHPRLKTCNRGQARHTISVGQKATVLSETTPNDPNLGEVLEERESKQIQPGEIMEEVLEESESNQIQPTEIMDEVLEERESNEMQPVGMLDSSRLTRHIRRRSRHLVSLGHRTLLRDLTINDTSLERVLEERELDHMHADDAVDSRRRSFSRWSYSRRRSRHTVLPERNSNNTSLEQILDESESEEFNPVSVSCLDMSLMHRSTSHRMVFPLARASVVEEKSLGFRDVFLNSSLSILRDISAVASSDNSKSSVGIEEVLDEVEPVITARDVVLQRCRQTEPLPFSEAFPDWCLEKCKKIGEGVYGEVFSLERPNTTPSVLKIIPIEGELDVNGEPQKTYEEILSEIVIAMELSELRHRKDFCTSGFSELIRCWCVQGRYPSRLLSLWFEFDNEKGSENDSPDVFSDDQLFIVLELANAGTDLESYVLNSAEQALAVFVQVTNSLAVAEGSLEFEHRDLHWGNILIKPTTEKTCMFILDGEEYHVPTKGLQVTIIDFTLSRITYDGCSIYNDLAQDPSLFTSQGDFQFEVYRLMKSTVQSDWQLFRPYTNVLWLRYVLDKMETGVHYRRKNTKTHKSSLSELRRLKKRILDSACSIAVMKSNLVSGF